MANWTINYFTVTGGKAHINELKEKAKYNPNDSIWVNAKGYSDANNSLFCLGCLYPEPAVPTDIVLKKYETQEYMDNWRMTHWGVREDIFDVVELKDESELWKIEFVSKWVPPLSAIHKISYDYIGLTFELVFLSLAGGFQGRTIFRDGKCVSDELEAWEDFDETDEEDPHCY